jgi:hypothetical protein
MYNLSIQWQKNNFGKSNKKYIDEESEKCWVMWSGALMIVPSIKCDPHCD